jgi:hypothetical protein
MNAIHAIHPYKHEGLWVFDDASVGLIREPFVAGADEIIDVLTQSIPGAAAGFTLIFSAQPFPGSNAVFDWRREEVGGNWYYCEAASKEGWLCPALFKYFETAPSKIYAQFREKRN